MPKVLLVDCYDSFTHTIVNYLQSLGAKVSLLKSDDQRLLDLGFVQPFSHIVLSPGPGHPIEYSILIEFIKTYIPQKPILGICLGHQAIAYALGGDVQSAPQVKHGKLSRILHNNEGLFFGFEQNFSVMRYHSLVIDLASCPKSLIMDAWTFDNQEILMMGFHHRDYPVYGLQYHPESILSDYGFEVLAQFLDLINFVE